MAKFCPNCGTQNEDTAMNCASCGTAFVAPAQPAAPAPAQPAAPGAKQKMVAGLLGIFLGGWGVHNFYLGNTKKAVIQIVVTLVTCGAGGIWGLIEGIMILAGSINTDANGNPLV